MVYGVTALLAFSTAARRDTVMDGILGRLPGRTRWGVDEVVAVDCRLGANALRVTLRYTSQADADDLKARVESLATGARAPLAGSWLVLHTCTHDEGTNDCVVVARRDW